ncbi:MAG: hypothetical protein OXI01_23265 [Albidovulum sp.]|nr:hypothetical protein [Albidovulum sp.]
MSIKNQKKCRIETDKVQDIRPAPDYNPATKSDVDVMITQRLMMFHDALVDRGQIKPIPKVYDRLRKTPVVG